MGRPRYFTSLFVAAATMTIVSQAAAQRPSASPSRYPVCQGTPSSQDVAIAKQTYELAVRRFNEGDYSSAIVYFKDAYRSDCTAHKLLTNLARAYELLGDRPEAVKALETYLERGNPPPEERNTVERRIRNLKELSENNEAAPAAVVPQASAAPPPAVTAVVPVAPPPPAAAPRSAPVVRSHTVPPWILFGVGGAAVVTGAVFFTVGLMDVSSAANDCPSRVNCASSVASKGNNGRTFETVGVAVGAVGLGAVAGGLLWHFLEPTTRKDTAARITPSVAPTYAGLSFDTRF